MAGIRLRTAVVVTALVALSAFTPAAAQDAGSEKGGEPTSAPAPVAQGVNDDVHLNEIQVIGSHNSYHEVATPAEADIRRGAIGVEAENALQYRHAPLPVQFQSQKVRQIELDLFLDPAGGKYANPLIRAATGGGPYDPAMNQPGIKVLHVQDVDYHSTCLSLKACLTEIETWSDANPTHAPIAILLELKDDEVPVGGFPFVVPDPFDNPAAMDSVDAEIRSVMSPDDMITPDDVRGGRATLDEAVTTDGWPTLGASRGKVMFLMDNSGSYRDAYLAGHAALAGRVLFTNADPGAPDAGFVERNTSSDPSIPGLVQAGYVVRTRADGETAEARSNDTTKRDAALASGAQWVSTDYPVANYGVGFQTSYVAEIPGGTVARCNPVNGPPSCVSGDIDTIYTPVQTPPVVVTAPPAPTPTPPVSPDPTPTVGPAAGARPVAGSPAYTG